MSVTSDTRAPLRSLDRFFIGGEWVKPSSDAKIDVIEAATEELFFRIAEAKEPDISRAVEAARKAFDTGPWPRMTHAQRAEYLRAIAAGVRNGPTTRARSGRGSPACSPRSPARE